MRYAIVESGGKQYRAVEGGLLEVDRLSAEVGKKLKLDRVLLAVSGDAILVGTPTISGVSILTRVLEHFKSVKTLSFQYRPKKRIRQKTGHRQLYTRLMVETIEGVKEDLTAKKEEKVEARAAGAKSGRTRPQKEAKAGKPAVEEKKSASTAKPKPAKPAAAPVKEKKPKAKPVAAPAKAKKPATSKKPAAADKTTKKGKK